MKTNLLSIDGKKQKEIDLPKVFSTKIREDIVKKVFEVEKVQHPYGPNFLAGKKHSASGTISHKRHDWKGHYGKGMSRIPRKTMWRRGTQFYWIGAEISSTRGGRRAHGPNPISFMNSKKVNKKEYLIALKSVIASTANEKDISSRYERLKDSKLEKMPIVVESKFSQLKSKDLIKSLKNILGDLNVVAIKEKSVRSGKGTRRNRKYKTTAGALIVIGNDEKLKSNSIDIVRVNDLNIGDLYPLGRVTIYTENAIKDLMAKEETA